MSGVDICDKFNEFHSYASDSNWTELGKLFKSIHEEEDGRDAFSNNQNNNQNNNNPNNEKGNKNNKKNNKNSSNVNLDDEIDAYFDEIDSSSSKTKNGKKRKPLPADPSHPDNFSHALFKPDNYGQLPLYYALFRDAPEKLIFRFLKYSHTGTTVSPYNMCSRLTCDGVYLLHVAAGFCNSLEVIKAVYRCYPPAWAVLDLYGCCPVDHARKHGIKRSNRQAIISLLDSVSSFF